MRGGGPSGPSSTQSATSRGAEQRAVRAGDHADHRPRRVGRVDPQHHRERAVVEPDEVAGGVDAHQLAEAADEPLVEARPVVLLEHREDAVGGEGPLVVALRSHRVVHVRDAAQLRREVQRRPRDAARVAGAVDAQVVLEGDDRGQRRQLEPAPQHLGAVDRVPHHDGELGVGQPLGLGEDLGRRPDLADVVHQAGEAELPEQRPVDAEAPRLGHGQHADVHHVRERVVVVPVQGRQRHHGAAVLADRARQALDERAWPGPGRGCPRPGPAPRGPRRRRRRPGRRAAWRACRPARRPPAAAAAAGRRGCAATPAPSDRRRRRRGLRRGGREAADELEQLLAGDAAIEGDALDADRTQPLDGVRRAMTAGERDAVDDDLPVDDADDDVGRLGVRPLERLGQLLDGAGHERMVGRVELHRLHAGRELAEQVLGDPNPPGFVAHAGRSSLEWRAAMASRWPGPRRGPRAGRRGRVSSDPEASAVPTRPSASTASR